MYFTIIKKSKVNQI